MNETENARTLAASSNQFPNRIAVIDEVLRTPRLIGDRGTADVDAKSVVQRCEYLLVVDRSVLWDFAQAVRRAR